MNNHQYGKDDNLIYKAIASLNLSAKDYLFLESKECDGDPFKVPLRVTHINNERYKKQRTILYNMRLLKQVSRTAKNIINGKMIGTYRLELDNDLMNEKGIKLTKKFYDKLDNFVKYNNELFDILANNDITEF